MSFSRLVQRHPDLDAAFRRLSGALDLLEAATARRERAEAERHGLDLVLAAMEEDRDRLAEALDAALKDRRSLAEAADDVAGRLRAAGVALRDVIVEREVAEVAEGARPEGRAEP